VDTHLNDLKQQLTRMKEPQVEEIDLLCAAVDHLDGRMLRRTPQAQEDYEREGEQCTRGMAT